MDDPYENEPAGLERRAQLLRVRRNRLRWLVNALPSLRPELDSCEKQVAEAERLLRERREAARAGEQLD